MSFDALRLTPRSGVVDVAAVLAHLERLPHALEDPIEDPLGPYWFMGATRRSVLGAREQRLADTSRRPYVLLIRVTVEAIEMHGAYSDRDELARGAAFVRWLMTLGEWTARDHGYPSSSSDGPLAFFPNDLPDIGTLVDCHTITPVIEGALWWVQWWRGKDDNQSLSVHSGGQWSYQRHARRLSGTLTTDAVAAFLDAAAMVDFSENVEDYGVNRITIERETPSEPENAAPSLVMLSAHAATPCASCKAFLALVGGWAAAIEQWTDGPAPHGIASIQLHPNDVSR